MFKRQNNNDFVIYVWSGVKSAQARNMSNLTFITHWILDVTLKSTTTKRTKDRNQLTESCVVTAPCGELETAFPSSQ